MFRPRRARVGSPGQSPGVWREPFTELRVPLLFHLRRDPFERAQHNSNTYNDWFLDRPFVIVPLRAVAARLLEAMRDYPPRQTSGSFIWERSRSSCGRTRARADMPRRWATPGSGVVTPGLAVVVLLVSWSAHAQTDALPSWNDGAAKVRTVAFVPAVTDPSSKDYVAPGDRVAVFDNDGTLWSEQPVYFQILFAIDRVKALAPKHPEWRTRPPSRRRWMAT